MTGAAAVVLNATVTNTTAFSWLIGYPTGGRQQLASNLNWSAGQTVSNRVFIALGTGGKVTFCNANGNTDLVIDVNG